MTTPHADPNLELALLGAIVAGNEDAYGNRAADLVLPLLSADDFADPAHRLICRAAMHAQVKRAYGPVAVLHELHEMGAIHAAGGETYVREDVPFYALDAGDPLMLVAPLQEMARARRLGDAVAVVAEAFRQGGPSKDFVERAKKKLDAAVTDASVSAEFESAATGIESVYNACFEGVKPRAYSTGFHQLNKTLGGGLYPTALTLIAARPGVGKTALAALIAFNVAALEKVPVLMFSLEMRPQEIWQRLAAAKSGVPHGLVRRRDVQDIHLTHLAPFVQSAGKVPFHIHAPRPGEGRPSAAEMRAIATAFKRKHGGLGLVVVDYVQLAVQPGAASMAERIGEVSAELKLLAMDLECAVIALSQLNRDAANERPQPHQLRGSGSLEQDADNVLMLWREADDSDRVELIVGKNRSGPIGEVSLRFLDQTVNFQEVA